MKRNNLHWVLLFNSTIDFDLVDLQSCNSTHSSFLVSWSASINKRSKLFSTRSENQRKHRSLRFTRNSSNLLNNEISLELRRSLYLRSKSHSKFASMTSLRQCNDLQAHHSINQQIDLSRVSVSISESATKTSFVNVMIYLLTSFYLSVNLIKCSHATSESASMTQSSSITSKSMSLFMYQISTNS